MVNNAIICDLGICEIHNQGALGFALRSSMGPGEELSVLEHQWTDNQVVVLGNKVADIVTAIRWVEIGWNSIYENWVCFFSDGE